MPLLSFVLALHREQAYVDRLADSLLGQSFTDFELVAIDDASPDHGPELLDALAARDGRVRVRHLERRAGRGAARNAGLELAAGDYVWFLNATDRLPAGALAPVAERLRADTPDVLLVQHSLLDTLGRSRPGPHGKLLARLAEAPPGPLDDHPALAAAAAPAWNKLFRRELLERRGARFGAGLHDELTLSWPALLAADRIAAVPGTSYERHTPENADRGDGSPFDVFARYDAVLHGAGTRAQLVAPAMLRHELALLARVPEPDRREFFGRMSAAYRAARGAGATALSGRVGRLRERLVVADAYAAYRLVEAATARRRALSRRRGRGRPKRPGELERYYRARLREPIDPDLAVFAAYWYRGYACNPRAIYERARELVPGMRGVWVVRPEGVAALPPGVEHVVAGTREYYDLIARARWFVNNVNFPNHLVKRAATVHVMTHHGTPLKQMGLDLRDAPRAGRPVDFAALLRRCRRWDYSVTANAFTTLIWERTYPTRYETLETGYPRNDVLARATDADVARVRAALGIDPGQRALLYAPTHREYLEDDRPVLDLRAVADALGPGYVIMARLHYFHEADAQLAELHRQGRIRDVAAHPSVEELCVAADALITDYSSIMFDYAVLDRPIVIHAPDWDTYRAKRGTYFDLMAEPPGVVATSAAGVSDALRSGTAWDEDARRLRAAFRARFCSLEDGRAAERVVRRVWLGERESAPGDAADRIPQPLSEAAR